MSSPDQSLTQVTLLRRLAQPGPVDEAAWREFVAVYGPKIYKWCRRWNLQDADAKDVTQQVLLKLATKISGFTYDPDLRFRGWLRTITHHAWRDFLAGQQRPGRGSGDTAVSEFLTTIEARDDLLRRLEDEADRKLLETAIARVKERVEVATWQAFELTAFQTVPAAEVARRLKKKVATVYVARSKVQRMLQEEMQQLLAAEAGRAN